MPSKPTGLAYLEETIDLVSSEYERSEVPWVVGFSGGKDSSAVLRVVYTALSRQRTPALPVQVVYCDTGVEIPIIARYVRRTLRALSSEARAARLPLKIRVARPKTEDSYFVNVIGRGYPPPTNKFRWCTDRLRIAPVKRIIQELSANGALILLGLRHGESHERDRTLKAMRHRGRFFRQAGSHDNLIYAPILPYSTEQVWETLVECDLPAALDSLELARLYRNASGECPLIRDPSGSPCGKGRFGCWTCTVVRQDRAMTGLVEHGFRELAPLLEFRNWLQQMRDEPAYRCARRRNGAAGPGPLTLDARRLILRRLRAAESRAGFTLVTDREVALIHKLWRADRQSVRYRDLEAT